MAYKGFEFKYDGFKYSLHVCNSNEMQLVIIYIWNMNFAGFISQKKKEI